MSSVISRLYLLSFPSDWITVPATDPSLLTLVTCNYGTLRNWTHNLQMTLWILDTYLFENGLILWYYYSCSAIQLWKADSRIKFFGPFPLPSMEKSFANSIFQVISLIIFGEISLALASWSIEKFWRLGFLHRVHIAWVLTFQFQCHLYIRMSHWHHTIVDGAKFWITCKRQKLLRKAGHN